MWDEGVFVVKHVNGRLRSGVDAIAFSCCCGPISIARVSPSFACNCATFPTPVTFTFAFFFADFLVFFTDVFALGSHCERVRLHALSRRSLFSGAGIFPTNMNDAIDLRLRFRHLVSVTHNGVTLEYLVMLSGSGRVALP